MGFYAQVNGRPDSALMRDFEFFYRAFGLNVASEVCLPELPPIGATEADVVIRLGNVPSQLGATEILRPIWAVNPREFLFHPPQTQARYYVRDGREIIVEIGNARIDRLARAFVLGSCFGAVLQQRGKLLLHASCFDWGGRAFALCGRSGAGKSTTAAMMLSAGARYLSDDTTLIEVGDEIRAIPGFPISKLSAQSLNQLGIDSAGLVQIEDERKKFIRPLGPDSFSNQPTPLAGIFVVRSSPNTDDVLCHRLCASAALDRLQRHSYRKNLLVAERRREMFRQLGEVVSKLPLVVITRPASKQSFGAVERALREQIASM